MAIATEGSGYGAFLPKYQNELVNREALRGQMVKEASYLTGMDTVYAQLEEQARQFDESLALNESQFSRKLEYEYEALERQSDYWDAQISLGWGQVESQERLGMAKLDLAQQELDFNRETRDMEYDLTQERMDMMQDIYNNFDYSSFGTTSSKSASSGKSSSEQYTSQSVLPEQSTMKSGWIDYGGKTVYSTGTMTPEQFSIAAR